jgi:hypothetical protein
MPTPLRGAEDMKEHERQELEPVGSMFKGTRADWWCAHHGRCAVDQERDVKAFDGHTYGQLLRGGRNGMRHLQDTHTQHTGTRSPAKAILSPLES